MAKQLLWVMIAICTIFAGLHITFGKLTKIRAILGGVVMLIGAAIMVLALSYTLTPAVNPTTDVLVTPSSAESSLDNLYCPDSWTVEYHYPNQDELLKSELYLSDQQESDKGIDGFALYEELMDKSVLSAEILDHLLVHPSLIPKEWEDKRVFFWGTIYRNSYDDLFVRCLLQYDGEWIWSCRCLDDEYWYFSDPAIISCL